MKTLPTKKGAYDNVDIEVYHQDITFISATALKAARGGIRAFVNQLLTVQESKPHFDFGNAFELALMDAFTGTTLFTENVAVRQTEAFIAEANKIKDYAVPKSSKVYKDLDAEFKQEAFGKYIINDVGTESHHDIKEMLKTLTADPAIGKLLSATEYQKTLVWQDKQTGAWCKTRPDINKRKKNIIVDIKTTIDASPTAFAKQAANLDYPVQAIMQINGAKESGLYEEVEAYYWLAVEKAPPYQYGIYRLGNDEWDWLDGLYRTLLERAVKGLDFIKAGKSIHDIPSYGLEGYGDQNGIMTIDLPLWYRS